MKTIKEIFGTEKPIIALLHIRELPTDPFYNEDCTIEEIIECARKELHALQDGGVDGILFSNEFSLPYLDVVEPITVSFMAYIIGALKDEIKVPYGVHVISDPLATIELAKVVGASFVRSVFTGAYAGENGLKTKNAAVFLRRKKQLGLDDLILYYMINAESDADISRRSLAEIAAALRFKCKPDGICLSATHAGVAVDPKALEDLRKASPGTPIYGNTGCKKDNIVEILGVCDGAFVGTTFKKDGKFENFVEYDRVKEFMDIVKENREV